MVMRNPFYVDPGRGVGQQLGSLGSSLAGLGQIMRSRQQQEQELQARLVQQERMAEGREAIKSAFQSNNPDAIAQTMIDYPELSDQLQGAMQFKSDATRQNMVKSAREIVLNPNNAQQVLTDRVKMIQDQGGDPTESILALKEFQENPDAALQSAKNLYAAYDPQGFKSYQAAQPQEAPQSSPYQQAQIELKREDQRLREIEAQLKREDNDLKREKLQADVDLQKAKVKDAQLKQDAAEGKKDASAEMASEAAKLAREIAGDKSFSNVVGTIDAMTPVVSGESQDLINKANRLQSLLTVDNLKLMSGVLTDKDISFLTNVASGLNITEGGIKGSEKGVKKRLEDIANRIEKSQGATQEAPESSSSTVNWDDL